MKVAKTLALAGLLSGSLIISGLTSTVAAHDKEDNNDQGKGKSKHYFCYDKHGRWRQHPHCPPPQQTLPHGHYYTKDYYHSHDYDYRRSGAYYHSHPHVIYVRKDGPLDPRSKTNPVVLRDSRNTVADARKEVQQSRDQHRKDQTELKNDRAELRRDLRNGASKDEIKKDRQEIRSGVDKVKSTKTDLRSDRRDLKKELANR